MKKRAFNLLSVISLVLLCAMTYAWIASQFRHQGFGSVSTSANVISGIGWFDGVLYICAYASPYRPTESPRWVSMEPSQWGGDDSLWHAFGFTYRVDSFRSGRSFRWFITSPLWFLATVFSVLPLLWIHQRFRRHVTPPGLCPTCGYDLRASPERCPECGTPVESSTISSSA